MQQKKKSVLGYFPFETLRQYQGETITEAYEYLSLPGKRFLMLELPTGAGKSVIAMTLARAFEQAYFITPQKILQAQYLRDFEKLGMRELKGRANYRCSENPSVTCAEGQCRITGKVCNDCPYIEAREAGLAADYTVFNPAYFLLFTSGGGNENMYPRQLLVIDEAHNTEQVLMNFINLAISDYNLKKVGLKLQWIDKFIEIIDNEKKEEKKNLKLKELINEFISEITGNIGEINKELRNAADIGGDLTYLTEVMQVLDALEALRNRLNFIRNTLDEIKWITYHEEQKSNMSRHKLNESSRRVIFKPLYIDTFTNRLFDYGEKIILMSATILDPEVIAKSLGINEYHYIAKPSTFPVKNRPIYIEKEHGRMSYNTIDDTLPKVAVRVIELLEQYPDVKGIIHCCSYKIQKYIERYLNANSPHARRLLVHNTFDRDEKLKEHLLSPGPTVLVSPSMYEGLDLFDDFSRFQIILKIPYPPWNDPQIKARRKKDMAWYDWLTALTLVQSYGRSIRNEEDYADTYILDGSYSRFYGRNKKRLPEWFKEAVVKKD